MSDTPLTDNAEEKNLQPRWVPVEFARDLERRLAATQDGYIESLQREAKQRAEIARLTQELESHAWEISPAMAQARIDQLTTENNLLKKVAGDWFRCAEHLALYVSPDCVARAEFDHLVASAKGLKGPYCAKCGMRIDTSWRDDGDTLCGLCADDEINRKPSMTDTD